MSPVTLRRDLRELEAAGYIRRLHGSVIAVGRASGRPYRLRERSCVPQKKAIAAAAARFVKSGDAIALDGGSTVMHMVDALTLRSNLTIITANLRTAWLVAQSPSLRSSRLLIAGGLVRGDDLAMSGESTLLSYRHLRVDTAFLGVAGVSVAAGITDYDFEDAELKRVLVESARKVIVLADGSKVGRESLAVACSLSRVAMLITDVGVHPSAIAELKDTGLEVLQAEVPGYPDHRTAHANAAAVGG